MLKHLCPRCQKNIIDYKDKYCPECSRNVKKDKAESNRIYDKNIRKNANVYASKIWHRVRQVTLNRDNNLCLCCWSNNKIKYAALVHHIVEVNEDVSKAYDINNLISVCRCCHNDIHVAYHKSDKDKKDMQEMLIELIGGNWDEV